MNRRLYLTGLLLLLLSCQVHAGVIKGKVLKIGGQQAVGGAVVRLQGASVSEVLSAADGSFTFDNVAPGVYNVLASHDLYYSSKKTNVQPGTDVRVELLEKRFFQSQKKVVTAQIDFEAAEKILPLAKEAEDYIAVYALVNRLKERQPKDPKLDEELKVAEAMLNKARATIEGNVVDQSGAVVPNAQIVLTSLESGAVVKTTTNDRGEYSAIVFPVGTYEITAIKGGMKPTNAPQKPLVATPNTSLNLSFVLK